MSAPLAPLCRMQIITVIYMAENDFQFLVESILEEEQVEPTLFHIRWRDNSLSLRAMHVSMPLTKYL